MVMSPEVEPAVSFFAEVYTFRSPEVVSNTISSARRLSVLISAEVVEISAFLRVVHLGRETVSVLSRPKVRVMPSLM